MRLVNKAGAGQTRSTTRRFQPSRPQTGRLTPPATPSNPRRMNTLDDLKARLKKK
jgi:hypothetical protein